MTNHTQNILRSLLFAGGLFATEPAHQPVSIGDPPESRSVAARYQTRHRTSNFFMRSRISAVRGA